MSGPSTAVAPHEPALERPGQLLQRVVPQVRRAQSERGHAGRLLRVVGFVRWKSEQVEAGQPFAWRASFRTAAAPPPPPAPKP
jgi:hypothetical protein